MNVSEVVAGDRMAVEQTRVQVGCPRIGPKCEVIKRRLDPRSIQRNEYQFRPCFKTVTAVVRTRR